MISLPKQSIRHYMSAPILSLPPEATLRDALHLFNIRHIHGAPVIGKGGLEGIITLSDVIKAIDDNIPLTAKINTVMTADVVKASGDVQLFDVIGRFKERKIGRLVVVDGDQPIGILTQSDIIRVFPSL
jgi:predicted transcriptional regulator